MLKYHFLFSLFLPAWRNIRFLLINAGTANKIEYHNTFFFFFLQHIFIFFEREIKFQVQSMEHDFNNNVGITFLNNVSFLVNLPGTTTTAGTTAAARTHVTTSPSPSPSSPWAWAGSSSPRPLHPHPSPQPPRPRPVTRAAACFPCRSAWAYASIMTPAECTFMTPTP